MPRSYYACWNHSPDSVAIKEKPLLVLYLLVCCQMNILFHLALPSTTGNLLISQSIHLIRQRIDLPVSWIDFVPDSIFFLVEPLTRRDRGPLQPATPLIIRNHTPNTGQFQNQKFRTNHEKNRTRIYFAGCAGAP